MRVDSHCHLDDGASCVVTLLGDVIGVWIHQAAGDDRLGLGLIPCEDSVSKLMRRLSTAQLVSLGLMLGKVTYGRSTSDGVE
jgi:hypothetical protein